MGIIITFNCNLVRFWLACILHHHHDWSLFNFLHHSYQSYHLIFTKIIIPYRKLIYFYTKLNICM